MAGLNRCLIIKVWAIPLLLPALLSWLVTINFNTNFFLLAKGIR
jgi:hypothetical protein